MSVEPLRCWYNDLMTWTCDALPVAIVDNGPNGAAPFCYEHLTDKQRAKLHLERARLHDRGVPLPRLAAA